MEATPVVETTVRVPGGSAIGSVYGAVIGASSPGLVVCDVANESPVPLALAVIVDTDSEVRVDADGVTVGDRRLVALTRQAGRFACADDLDDLHGILDRQDFDEVPPRGMVTGALALVVPLPHRAHGVLAIDPPPGVEVDREMIPGPDNVAAGWTALEAQGPALDLADPALTDVFRSAAGDLRLGPDADDVAGVCSVAAARSRLGDPEGGWSDVANVARLTRGDGRIGGRSGAVGRTAAFLDAVVAAVSGGLDPEELGGRDAVVGAMAGAAHWLSVPRRSFGDPAARAAAARSVAWVPAVLRLIDQVEAAEHLASMLRQRGDRVGPPEFRPWPELRDGDISTRHAGPDDGRTARRSSRIVSGVLASVVGATPNADAVSIDVLGGWVSECRGRSIEVHRVPVFPGIVSVAVRWHGDRPALLWECRTWPDRAPVELVWTASGLDHDWVATGLSGEALLGVPPEAGS